MDDQLIKVMERENSNIELFPMLENDLLETIIGDLKTNLKDILFELFKTQISGKSKEILFSSILSRCKNLLNEEINKISDFNNKELIVWHRSIFMSLKSFANSVSLKYTLNDHEEVVELLKRIFETSFYDFLDYNSNKEKLKTNLKEKLLVKMEFDDKNKYFLKSLLNTDFLYKKDYCLVNKDLDFLDPNYVWRDVNEDISHVAHWRKRTKVI